MNDLYIHPRSWQLLLLNGRTAYHFILRNVVSTSLSRTVLRHYFWSERNCLWPWELLHFWQRSLNYKLHVLSNLCVIILVKSRFTDELLLLQRFQTTKVTFKLIQVHQQSCHSIYDFLFVFHCNCVSILHRFQDIVADFRKYKDVMWPWPCPFKGQFIIPMLNRQLANHCTKFEISSFSRSGDIS